MTNNELWNRYDHYMHIQGPANPQWECATVFILFFGLFVSFAFEFLCIFFLLLRVYILGSALFNRSTELKTKIGQKRGI